jgi:NADH-quinone oxidoreductase subunit M
MLSLSWVVPLAGALLLLLIPNADGRRNGVIRWLALLFSILGFAVTLAVWARFNPTS